MPLVSLPGVDNSQKTAREGTEGETVQTGDQLRVPEGRGQERAGQED